MKRTTLFLAVALGLATAPAAMAQSDLGLKHVGVSLGFVSPERLDATFSFGAFADWGQIAPKVTLESRVDHWSWSETLLGVESKLRDISVAVRGKYHFETANPKVRPFAGAGLGMHFLNAEVTDTNSSPATSVSDSQTKLGLDLGGGLMTPLNPRTDFVGEAWYGIVSDVTQFSIRAGLSYKIGK